MAFTIFKAGLVGAVALVGAASDVAAQAQGKLSDKSVKTLMDYAWQILPSKFTTPAGKVIEVDKTKREANSVPAENGREIIRVAYSSAQAQICELWEEQQANYDTLMRREIGRKKWSDQQLLYITTLHRMTIHAVAGKLRVEEKRANSKCCSSRSSQARASAPTSRRRSCAKRSSPMSTSTRRPRRAGPRRPRPRRRPPRRSRLRFREARSISPAAGR
jgi:hypothetical protein